MLNDENETSIDDYPTYSNDENFNYSYNFNLSEIKEDNDKKIEDAKKDQKEKDSDELDKYKRGNRRKRILNIILVIIIIILLLLLIRSCDQKNKASNNYDVFEITCDCNKKDDTRSVDVTDDENNKWTLDSTNKLRIFENSIYGERIIAPGSHNTYHFIIKNNNDCTFDYLMKFQETNPNNMNLMFKLKRNGVDLYSDWTKASDLNLEEYKLATGEQDDYLLEWKWVESSNDTENGINESKYTLSIAVNSKSDQV